MNVLSTIMDERRDSVRRRQRLVPLNVLLSAAKKRRHHSLVDRLRACSGIHAIAEIKKASPSAGLLRKHYSPARLATAYAEAGASAISVLTEPLHFLGSEKHLRAVRSTVDLPILRKDFMCDPYQVAEAAAWGADIVLLIVAALDPKLMRDLYQQATELRLEVLAEAHTEAELDRALALPRALVGVNCRNLKTLHTDVSTLLRLRPRIPAGRLTVAESGIHSSCEVETLKSAGYHAFLIGETLMRSPNPRATLTQLLLAKTNIST